MSKVYFFASTIFLIFNVVNGTNTYNYDFRDVEDEKRWIEEKIPLTLSEDMGRNLQENQVLQKKHKVSFNFLKPSSSLPLFTYIRHDRVIILENYTRFDLKNMHFFGFQTLFYLKFTYFRIFR